MGVNGAIVRTAFTDVVLGDKKIKPIHIVELRAAITRLQGYAVNVSNCGNCVFCQSCQGTTCQKPVCQSQSCQSATCQSCQSVVMMLKGPRNCGKPKEVRTPDCDCSDDS